MASDMEHADLKQTILSTFQAGLSINQDERRNAEDKIKILETTESKSFFLWDVSTSKYFSMRERLTAIVVPNLLVKLGASNKGKTKKWQR